MTTDVAKIIDEFNKDKDLKGMAKTADGSLFSDIPYYISSQIPTLDFAITRPGIPAGRLTTLMGPEGSSKSSLVNHFIAQCQKMGGIAMLHDSENRFTRDRATNMGVDVDKLIMVEGVAEKVLDSIEKFIESVRKISPNAPALAVIDSIAGLQTQKRADAGAGDIIMSEVARLLSQNLARIHGKAAANGVALLFTNQLRSYIHIGDPRTVGYAPRRKVMGQQDTMIGERALVYWSSLMLHIAQIGMAGENKDDPTGIRSRAKVVKCSIGPGEGRSAEYEMDKMTGANISLSRFELLTKLGILKESGGWYKLDTDIFPNATSFRRADFEAVWAEYPKLGPLIDDAPEMWAHVEEHAPVEATEYVDSA